MSEYLRNGGIIVSVAAAIMAAVWYSYRLSVAGLSNWQQGNIALAVADFVCALLVCAFFFLVARYLWKTVMA